MNTATLTIIVHLLVTIAITVRVIMKRPPTGTALAWLFLVALIPFAGAIIYLLIGERRLSPRRSRRIQALLADHRKICAAATKEGLNNVDWSHHSATAQRMDRLGQKTMEMATVIGSSFELYSDTQEMLKKITQDVEQAKTSVLMEFYIWNEGGAADDVLEAVIRAAKRGVTCRLLLDALGSRPWWNGEQPQKLRDAGVKVLPALPVGLLQSWVGRTDLRLHRKIVVVDSEVAWTGSMNLVDPRFFKQDAGVGEWVDAMIRLKGAVVAPLASTMIGDWMLESGEPIKQVIKNAGLHLVEPSGETDIQVIPSGPGETGDGLLQMLLALINGAERELILTTPYLVPDESMLRALRGAAGRGVKVQLILPKKVDSILTRYASRSYYDDLLDMGVEIHLYRQGLLHTKSIMADGEISMFGTVNLDMRSLWLNYELALFVYEPRFAKELLTLQKFYLGESDKLDPATWGSRSFGQRFLENTLRLASPLL